MHPKSNLKGKKFFKLTVISDTKRVERDGYNINYYTCLCDCGNLKDVSAASLLAKNGTRSCGCWKKLLKKLPLGDLIYRTWNKISKEEIEPDWRNDFMCFYEAVSKEAVKGWKLKLIDKSKGYFRGNVFWERKWDKKPKKEYEHLYKTKEYSSWSALRDRCKNTKNANYYRYGGRGITVCKSWDVSFKNFLLDMGLAPTANHSIERINNSLGYYKENCKWATQLEQLMNRRNTIICTYNNETKPLIDFAKEYNIPYRTLLYRVRKSGVSIDVAINTPLLNRKETSGAAKHIILIKTGEVFATKWQAAEKLKISKYRLDKMLLDGDEISYKPKWITLK